MKRIALIVSLSLLAGAVSAQQPQESTVLLRTYESLIDGDEMVTGSSREESFTVTVPADGTLRVTVVSPDFFPSVGVGTETALLRAVDGVANVTRVSVRVESGQRIRIVVAVERLDPADTFAEYLMSVVLSEGDERLSLGSSLVGNLAIGDERSERGSFIDWHEIDLPSETRIRVDLSSYDFDTYLTIELPDGSVIENDDADGSDSRLMFSTGEGGPARIGASSYGSGSTGEYTLEVLSDTYDGPEIADGYRLTDGEVVFGALRPSVGPTTGPQGQRFTFDAEPGERLEIVLRSEDFDSYLEIVGPDGSSTTDDDSAGGLDSRIVLSAGSSGVYEVYARDLGGQSMGSYTLSFSRLDVGRLLLQTRGELTSDDAVDISGKYYDIHPFTVTEGRLVTIDVLSSDYDGYAIVRSESGQILYRDDDSGGNSNPRIVFTAERSETLELVVTTFSAETIGGYSVSIYE